MRYKKHNLILMKIIILNLFLILFFFGVLAQTAAPGSKILSLKESGGILTPALKAEFKISYPVRKVYQCQDLSGKFLIIVTESNDKIDAENDTLNHHIKALNLAYTPAGLVKKWEISDVILNGPNNDHPEKTMWFKTKLFGLKDLDNDGLIDPVIVYGTENKEEDGYGRVKIIIYYKGAKIAIRHQDGSLDSERNTRVDKAFYMLPLRLQSSVRLIMKTIAESRSAIFPYGWQKAMDRKKTYIDESH